MQLGRMHGFLTSVSDPFTAGHNALISSKYALMRSLDISLILLMIVCIHNTYIKSSKKINTPENFYPPSRLRHYTFVATL